MNWLDYIMKARKVPTEHLLRTALSAAARHVDTARTVRWPALAESWERDADVIRQMLIARIRK